MILLGSKEYLQKRVKSIPYFIELWDVFPEDWFHFEMWWESYRTYFRFIFTVSIPRRWWPHASDGEAFCNRCYRIRWIEDRLLNKYCNQCRQWIAQVEETAHNELGEYETEIWDTFRWKTLATGVIPVSLKN